MYLFRVPQLIAKRLVFRERSLIGNSKLKIIAIVDNNEIDKNVITIEDSIVIKLSLECNE
jgi:hypothetical protein